MGAIHAIMYCAGITVFGGIWWFLNGMKGYFEGMSETGLTYDLFNYIWLGIIIIYLIGGGIWLIRKYSEKETYIGGFR